MQNFVSIVVKITLVEILKAFRIINIEYPPFVAMECGKLGQREGAYAPSSFSIFGIAKSITDITKYLIKTKIGQIHNWDY